MLIEERLNKIVEIIRINDSARIEGRNFRGIQGYGA